MLVVIVHRCPVHPIPPFVRHIYKSNPVPHMPNDSMFNDRPHPASFMVDEAAHNHPLHKESQAEMQYASRRGEGVSSHWKPFQVVRLKSVHPHFQATNDVCYAAWNDLSHLSMPFASGVRLKQTSCRLAIRARRRRAATLAITPRKGDSTCGRGELRPQGRGLRGRARLAGGVARDL